LKKQETPDASPFKHAQADDSAGFLLWKITALWQKKLACVLGVYGITQTQYAIMASLKWFETHLAEHTKIDKMTLSKAIRKLEETRLIRRTQSSSDNRATNVAFTAHGKKVIQAAVVAIENADDEFFSSLTEKQLDTYKSLTISIISGNDP
jgi:MarR family transcriptional regulator for hemolysin